MSNKSTEGYFQTLHEAAPYVRQHNGVVMVAHLPAGICTDAILACVIKEIKIVQQFGSRVILIHGLKQEETTRALSDSDANKIQTEAALLRSKLEKCIGDGYEMLNGTAAIRFYSRGVEKGIEQKHRARMKVITPEKVKQQAKRALILVSPHSYLSGNVVAAPSLEIARELAVSLKARKLLLYSNKARLFDATISSQHTVDEIEGWLQTRLQKSSAYATAIKQAIVGGVQRVHMVNAKQENALLKELYTREGSGILIRKGMHQKIRNAASGDVHAIYWLLQNPQVRGVFLPRSLNYLSRNISNFQVAILDGEIIGVLEIKSYRKSKHFEIGGICVQDKYVNRGIMRMLINRAENEIIALGGSHSFVLTTTSADYFMRMGYQRSDPLQLPLARRRQYDKDRKPIVLVKILAPNP